MTGSMALSSGVTPLAVETVVAAMLVALGVALLILLGYVVVVSSLAWVLVVVIGLARLGWAGLCLAAARLRRRVRSTPPVQAAGLTPGPPRARLLH